MANRNIRISGYSYVRDGKTIYVSPYTREGEWKTPKVKSALRMMGSYAKKSINAKNTKKRLYYAGKAVETGIRGIRRMNAPSHYETPSEKIVRETSSAIRRGPEESRNRLQNARNEAREYLPMARIKENGKKYNKYLHKTNADYNYKEAGRNLKESVQRVSSAGPGIDPVAIYYGIKGAGSGAKAFKERESEISGVKAPVGETLRLDYRLQKMSRAGEKMVRKMLSNDEQEGSLMAEKTVGKAFNDFKNSSFGQDLSRYGLPETILKIPYNMIVASAEADQERLRELGLDGRAVTLTRTPGGPGAWVKQKK